MAIYRDWFRASARAIWSGENREQKGPSVFERSNLIQLQTLVTYETPDRRPHLLGETYMHVPILLVPRVFWDEKPHGHISTEVIGIYYGVHTVESARYTSIGFGLLSEAWANFGWFGIIGLALFFGWSMQFMARICEGRSPTALVSILSVVWMGWSFRLESAMSSWIVSLLQGLAMAAVVVYPFTRVVHVRSEAREHAERKALVQSAEGG